MCSGDVAMNVWIRALLAGFSASAARWMSLSLARASEQIVLSFTRPAIVWIASKSPFELAAKPASITSTFIRSRCFAMRIFFLRHRRTGRLFAVTQRRIENDQLVCHGAKLYTEVKRNEIAPPLATQTTDEA